MEELCETLENQGLVKKSDGKLLVRSDLTEFEIPDSVQALLRSRLDLLPRNELLVLRVLSAIGEVVPEKMVLRVLDGQPWVPAALEGLKKAELIREIQFFPEARYGFQHSITQTVTYETLLAAQRKRLHGRIGEAMEEVYADRVEENLEALALHFGNSDHSTKALHYAEWAGDKAAQLFSLAEARKHYALALARRAADLPDHRARLHRIDLTIKLVSVSFYGLPAALQDAVATALADAEALRDKPRVLQLTFWMGFIQYAMGNIPEAQRHFQDILAAAEVPGSKSFVALAENYLARLHLFKGDFTQAIDGLERGAKRLEAQGMVTEAANSLSVAALAHGFRGSFDQGLAPCRRTATLSGSGGGLAAQAVGHVTQALVHVLRGDWAQAARVVRTAEAEAVSTGIPSIIGIAKWVVGLSDAKQGRPEPGIAQMEAGIEQIETSRSLLGLTSFCAFLAEESARNGRRATATKYLRKAQKLQKEGGDRLGAFGIACTQAQLAPAKGASAEKHIERALRIARNALGAPEQARGQFRHAELLAARGQTERALEMARGAEKQFAELGMEWWAGQAKGFRRGISPKSKKRPGGRPGSHAAAT